VSALPPPVSGGTRLTSDVSNAPQPEATPAELDAVLAVLARHVRELAPLGTVRVAAGAVVLELAPTVAGPPTAGPVPAPAVGNAPPPLAAVPDPTPVVEHEGPVVRSSTVGVFYRAAEPGAAPFVAEGDTVAVGQQVGLVEAMKLMIPLESDRAGRVEEFLVADGESVEHGQPVLRLAGDAAQRSSTHRSSS
jgi:acetyl-CoA carboxylase biotin carboxyl carrier protein